MRERTLTLKLVQITFWLNGKQLSISVPPGMTALELLNNKLSLTGTKSSCNEGDCGACTVVLGSVKDGKVMYNAVNSCLYPAFRLHNKHLITVEGLSEEYDLHPIQEALLDMHGTQCGFCTPGFVMSILGMFLNKISPTKEEILSALEGNLCRCTGYDSIVKAVNLAKTKIKKDKNLLPDNLKQVEPLLLSTKFALKHADINNQESWDTVTCFIPQTLTELWDSVRYCKPRGSFKFLSGGTDLMVLANIQHIRPLYLIDLFDIADLQGIRLSHDKGVINDKSVRETIVLGANVTMTELMKDKLIAKHLPVLVTALSQMASTQIRNSATLAGNIANASPVADGATTLLTLEAEVIIAKRNGERKVKLCDFYQGYKKTELKPDEIIKEIVIPVPQTNKIFTGFLKSAKRKAVDISGVVSAVKIQYKDKVITDAVISFGGVAPYPALATQTMAFLHRKKIEASWFEHAAEVAMSEFKPITDVRGNEAYRSLLIKNHIIKHLEALLMSVQ
jgi:xanthine dehydrogenase small subunit